MRKEEWLKLKAKLKKDGWMDFEELLDYADKHHE